MTAPLGHRVVLFMRLYDRLRDEPYGEDTKVSFKASFGGPDGGRVETNTQQQEWKSYLVYFRQFIMPGESVYLGGLIRDLGPHGRDLDLRTRLACARRAWLDAHKPSLPAVLMLGDYGYPKKMNALYMYGGIFHSDPLMSERWESIDQSTQTTIEWSFRNYEGKVRHVVVETRKVILEGIEKDALDIPGLKTSLTSHDP